jgi:F-type H+-transporting ATPase subunit delta
MRRGGALARRYARALFALGEERGGARALLGEIEGLLEVVAASAALRRVLFTPLHPRAERAGVIREIAQRLGLSADLGGFALLLVEENRTALLPEIREALRERVEQAEGRLKAEVVSARPLEAPELDALRQALSRRVQADVTLEPQVDSSLVGGVVVRLGDLLLDGSVRTQLASLRGSLEKGAR